MSNKIDFQRIAFWAKQPVFGRDSNGLLDIGGRVERLMRMHKEFGTEPTECFIERFMCESRAAVQQMFKN